RRTAPGGIRHRSHQLETATAGALSDARHDSLIDMYSGATTRWRGAPTDRTRQRTVTLNQLLLGVTALLSAFVAFAMDALAHVSFLLSGMLVILVLTGVALAVPWNRVHPL